MHESRQSIPSILLPKRLEHRIPLIEPGESAGNIAAGNDFWGLSRRIAALPGTSTTTVTLDDGAIVTEHFVDSAYVLRHAFGGPYRLCRIDLDGIMVPRMEAADKAEVVSKKWAAHDGEEIVLFMPRDSIEMEIAWKIILRAYQYLASKPPQSGIRRNAAPDLPKCASTARYWM